METHACPRCGRTVAGPGTCKPCRRGRLIVVAALVLAVGGAAIVSTAYITGSDGLAAVQPPDSQGVSP